ncbi:serine hydrolase [Lewinella sp. W8]|uniref:serine hydrolase n=1 Tax=Lewinella sp. W8 TaxID=2528208 RepID=UPI001067B1DD|nr:serine hydrolase [Lewinella sp. W8]MTB50286.1 serine hydrolase [Lewinella sp. W8]
MIISLSRRCLTLTLLCFSFLFSACHGQEVPDPGAADAPQLQQIRELVSTYADYGEFNGAVLVAHRGKVVFQEAYGQANMEWDIPNTTDTRFRIGSISKQFAAVVVLQLAAEGKLDLHVPINTYLPDYPANNGQQVTLHHLLTHTAGIPNNYPSTKPAMNRPDAYTAHMLVEEFAALPLEFTPGERFEYSNAGYNLIGYLLEIVSGSSYEELLQERIFTPLGMKNSGFERHRALSDRRASGYFQAWGEYYNANHVDMSTVFAAGALYSTVEDLFLWDRALYSGDLLPEAYRDLMFERHVPDPSYDAHYGYGWSVKEKPLGDSGEEVLTLSHDGVIDGFCALLTRIPSREAIVILLSNVRRAPLNTMTKGLMGILYDQPYSFPRRSVAYSTLEVINAEGIEAGIRYFHSVKDDEGHYLIEDELNIISYRLLNADRADLAARVLELGIEQYPEAFNLYDSYGEVLRKLGRIDGSIANYRKSLELNPENTNAVEMLKEMGVTPD